MNTILRTGPKNNSEKDSFMVINNAVFGKTMQNVRKHKDEKLITTNQIKNQLVSQPNYHTTNFFPEDFLAREMKNK